MKFGGICRKEYYVTITLKSLYRAFFVGVIGRRMVDSHQDFGRMLGAHQGF